MVQEYKLEKVKVDDIKLDSTNPNVMSELEFEALKKGMEKYGYLSPVILDTKNKVLDGEHRVIAYKQLGKKSIPAYRIDVKRNDGKILRQIMNKLRGEHDRQKDKEEFLLLQKAGKLDDMADLLGRDVDDFMNVIDNQKDEVLVDNNPVAHHEDTFLHGNIKQIMIYFSNDEYEAVIPRIQRIMVEKKIDNHTDVFMELLNSYESRKSRKN